MPSTLMSGEPASPCHGNTAQLGLIKSSDFWLEDGNIILACGSTGYRAHQVILGMHSSVFHDMFAMGPGQDDRSFEGCAVVEMTDSAIDILCMLKALYFRDYPAQGQKQDLDVLASLMRMATKYMLDDLRREVAARLKLMFPDRYGRYNQLVRANVMPKEFNPFVAVQLGQTYGLPSIVPLAMYLCVVRESHKDAFWQPVDGGAEDSLVQLRYSCLRFMNALKNRIDEVFLKHHSQSPWQRFVNGRWECQQTDVQEERCAGLPSHARHMIERECRILVMDIFTNEFPFDDQDGHVLCETCRNSLTQYEHSVKQSIWNLLPTLLGWSHWNVVKEEQRVLDESENEHIDTASIVLPRLKRKQFDIPLSHCTDIARIATPRKHRKEEERAEDDSAVATFEQDNELWLHCGNLVLLCERTGFRVHRSVLTLHSTVFRDLLSDYKYNAWQFEECPVVVLPDSAQDMHHMLKALYSRHYATEKKLDFAVLASLLRIASTYRLPNIRKEAVARLRIILPNTHFQYDHPWRNQDYMPADFDPAVAVQLSKHCSVPIILPLALYLCALQRGVQSVPRTPKRDNPDAPPEVQLDCLKFMKFMNNFKDAMDEIFLRIDETSPKLWRHLVDGRWVCVGDNPQSNCQGFSQGAKQRMEIKCKKFTIDVFESRIFYYELDDLEGADDGACSNCRNELKSYRIRLQELLWDALVMASGLETWDAVDRLQRDEEARRGT